MAQGEHRLGRLRTRDGGRKVAGRRHPARGRDVGRSRPIPSPRRADDVPDFQAGDTLKVHVRVVEGSKERVQVFQGVVIARSGGGLQETFTVRKQSFGVGVERTFPVHSPKIERIERIAEGDVRRAKLYYLREKVGKKARVREKQR